MPSPLTSPGMAPLWAGLATFVAVDEDDDEFDDEVLVVEVEDEEPGGGGSFWLTIITASAMTYPLA